VVQHLGKISHEIAYPRISGGKTNVHRGEGYVRWENWYISVKEGNGMLAS